MNDVNLSTHGVHYYSIKVRFDVKFFQYSKVENYRMAKFECPESLL